MYRLTSLIFCFALLAAAVTGCKSENNTEPVVETWVVAGGGTPEADQAVWDNVRAELLNIYNPKPDKSGNPPAYTGNRFVKLVMPDVTSGPDARFEYFYQLSGLVLPKVQTVGQEAFVMCTALASVELPAATEIRFGAFYRCTALTTISLPKAVKVGRQLFQYCSNLASIDLPLVDAVSEAMFHDCTALTKLNLPKAASVGPMAFYGCTALTELKLTTPGALAVSPDAFVGFATSSCALTLNPDKASQVVGGNQWGGQTWKSINFQN